jgi:UDP-glucose 4-epimerase
MNKTVLITGAGGYVGSLITQALANGTHDEKDFSPEKIIALDVRDCPKSLEGLPKVTFIKNDVRGPELAQIIDQYKPDVVCHLASIVTPGKNSNREFEYSVDVLGTKNVLDACVKSGVKKVIITSSGAAYGYHADNPMWLKEDHPLRGNQEFAYSDHKRLVEEMLKEYREKHPELKQLIFRPGAVIGKTVKNQITDLFDKPVIMGIVGSDSPFTFIWDQDVVNILIRGIANEASGAFNLAGDGALTMKQIAGILNKPYLPIPPVALRFALKILKKAGLTQYGPEQIRFIQYRPVLSNDNLKNNFKYIPKKTSKEAFLYYLSGKQSK